MTTGSYLLSGNGVRADWVRNVRADPRMQVEMPSSAGIVESRPYLADLGPFPDEQAIREGVDARYHGWSPGHPLSGWVAGAVVVRLRPMDRPASS